MKNINIIVIIAFVAVLVCNVGMVTTQKLSDKDIKLTLLSQVALAESEGGDTSCWIDDRRHKYNSDYDCYYPCQDDASTRCCANHPNAC